MPATGASCGATSGEREVARTSATAGRPCGATISFSRRRTTTWFRSMRGRARSAGTSRSQTSSSSTSRPWRRSSSATTCSSGPATISTPPDSCSRYDPESGKRKWIFYTVPMNPGDPGLDTWPSLEVRATRRRTGLDSRRLRSGDEALYLRYRQSNTGVHRRRAQGGQSLYLLARRGQRRHGEDGVVLPDLAARHA